MNIAGLCLILCDDGLATGCPAYAPMKEAQVSPDATLQPFDQLVDCRYKPIHLLELEISRTNFLCSCQYDSLQPDLKHGLPHAAVLCMLLACQRSSCVTVCRLGVSDAL